MADQPDYAHGQPKPIPNDGESTHDMAIESIRRRKDYGRNKYGTILQVGNGRDFLTDAHEEALDGLAYLEGMRAEREVEKQVIRELLDYITVDWPDLSELPRIPWIAAVLAEYYGKWDGWTRL